MSKPRVRVRAGESIGVVVNMAEYAPAPDEALITAMESLGEMIVAGEITGLALAAARFDGGVTTCYVLGDRALTLISAVRQLQRRVESDIPLV